MIKDLNYKNKSTGIEIIVEDYDEMKIAGTVTIIMPNGKKLVQLTEPEDIDNYYSESEILKLVSYFLDNNWNEHKEKIFEACYYAPICIDLLSVAESLLSEKDDISPLSKYKYFCAKECSWKELCDSIINDFYPELKNLIDKKMFINYLKNGEMVYINTNNTLYKRKGFYWEYNSHIYGYIEDTNT